jgi:hypothetical protein
VLAVIAAGALATIALWWNDTTAIRMDSVTALTNAGRVTGLLAGYGVWSFAPDGPDPTAGTRHRSGSSWRDGTLTAADTL